MTNFQKKVDICVCLKDLINVTRFLNKLCSVEHTKCSAILQGASESACLADFLLFSQAVFLFFTTRQTVNMPYGNPGWQLSVLHIFCCENSTAGSHADCLVENILLHLVVKYPSKLILKVLNQRKGKQLLNWWLLIIHGPL